MASKPVRLGLAGAIAVGLAVLAITDRSLNLALRLSSALVGTGVGLLIAILAWDRLRAWHPRAGTVILVFGATAVLGPLAARSWSGVLLAPVAGGVVLGVAWRAAAQSP